MLLMIVCFVDFLLLIVLLLWGFCTGPCTPGIAMGCGCNTFLVVKSGVGACWEERGERGMVVGLVSVDGVG